MYRLLHIALHTETGEEVVVYQGLYDTDDLGPQPIFVRPREMFEEKVRAEAREVDRFSEVSE